MSIIATKDLGHQYGRRRGISNVSFQISEGQIYGFLGPNGAGKTTTIRILLGFLKPQHGSASIFGMDCWSASRAIKQEVGYVAGDVRLYPWLNIRRGLKLVQTLRGGDPTKTGLALCERLNLDPELPVRKMSRGNRQKVALVLALAHQPKLIILDEPTSGLDPVMQLTLMDILRESVKQGSTVLFSSHSLSEVESLCSHVLMIRQGQLLVDESLKSLQAKSPRVACLTLEDGQEIDSTELPKCVISTHRKESAIEMLLEGSAQEFMRWAAKQPLADISISPPSLDRLFRNYYLEDEST